MDAKITTATETDEAREKRAAFRLRHARGVASLMEGRADLRGIHALADMVDDAVRWTA